ncbi:hydrolase [Streptomyces halstedii]|uniref:Hydrolase n=1 Tax=Streptomyces halstedii TaxID=1944 RepID=A0ABS6TQ91_STRHA|nr:hydrolase [Streptomyces halstedii]MBV7670384.1 hydrolase [Streptomyces halstedii]
MPDSRPRWPGGGTAGPASSTLLLSGVRLSDGRTADVLIGGRRIEAVGAPGSLGTQGTRLDLRGYLLLPAPAEPHAHSDTALTASPGQAGANSATPGQAGALTADDVRRRATEAALLQLSHGATALRAQVRVTTGTGLAPLDAVLEAGRSLRGLMDLTVVAVSGPLTGRAGADGLALLRDAVDRGADVVGGRPDLDPDPGGHAEAVLGLAAGHGLPVDLHTDADDPALLARYAATAGEFGPGVSLGPCGGLSRLPEDMAAAAADRLAAAGVTVVCLPQGGCAGSRLRDTAPAGLLRAAGVRLAAGSGALRDAARPVGRGDPLEAAYLLAAQHGLDAAAAYEAVSATARAAMGLPEVRVEAGSPAELLAVRGDDLPGALSLAYSRIVVHRGRVVARTGAVREYRDRDPGTGSVREDRAPGGGVVRDASARGTAGVLGLPRQGRTGPGGEL